MKLIDLYMFDLCLDFALSQQEELLRAAAEHEQRQMETGL